MAEQTRSFLQARFEQCGIHPKTKYGQNFLIDMNLQRMIVDSGEITREDLVFEVGTGTGALTARVAQLAGAVLSIEVDYQMHALASEELSEFDNVTLLLTDALRNKNAFSDEVLGKLDSTLAEKSLARYKLVANLPYNIATPVLSNLLRRENPPEVMVATIQKELADRIIAKPRSKDYSALSIWMQAQAEVEIVRIMAPSVFWPRPKVESAIVRIRYKPELRARISDLEAFHEFNRAMFFHRRKFLRSVLLSYYKKRLGKPEVDAVMSELGYDGNTRAEELPVDEMIKLCEASERMLRETIAKNEA